MVVKFHFSRDIHICNRTIQKSQNVLKNPISTLFWWAQSYIDCVCCVHSFVTMILRPHTYIFFDRPARFCLNKIIQIILILISRIQKMFHCFLFWFLATVPARWQLQLSTVLLGEYSYGAVSMSCLPSHPGLTQFLTGVILFYKTIWLFIKSYLDKNSLTKCERFLAWLTNQPPWIEQIEKSL